jgi:hypothetical protein
MLAAVSDSTPLGTVGYRVEQVDEAEQRRQILIAESGGVEVFAAAELERVEGSEPPLLVFLPNGSLWVQGSRHDVDVRGREKVRVVYEGPSGQETPRYLVRASDTVGDYPDTLTELEERQARKDAARERNRAKQAAELDALRRTARPVSLNDFERGFPATLRAVAERLDSLGGTVRIEGGRLVVSLPESALGHTGEGGGPGFGLRLAGYLYRGEEAILAAVKNRNGSVSPAKLPDQPITPRGALL